jgi:hypothetical protein
MADHFYALEKLADAVDALATGTGRVQERLGEAAMRLHSVHSDEIPADLRQIFVDGTVWLLSWRRAVKEGLRVIGDEDASAIRPAGFRRRTDSTSIFELRRLLCQRTGRF